jgi:hypothetical protein
MYNVYCTVLAWEKLEVYVVRDMWRINLHNEMLRLDEGKQNFAVEKENENTDSEFNKNQALKNS